MLNLKPLYLILFILALGFPLQAQTSDTGAAHEASAAQMESGGFFISPLAEALLYGRYNLAYGGGLAIGAGDRGNIGLRFLYAMDEEKFIFMELLFFLRVYMLNSGSNTGPFLQFNGGPVLFAQEKPERSGFGTLSAGLGAGWRFPLGRNWFIEPIVRGGYPYLVGGGLSAGYRK